MGSRITIGMRFHNAACAAIRRARDGRTPWVVLGLARPEYFLAIEDEDRVPSLVREFRAHFPGISITEDGAGAVVKRGPRFVDGIEVRADRSPMWTFRDDQDGRARKQFHAEAVVRLVQAGRLPGVRLPAQHTIGTDVDVAIAEALGITVRGYRQAMTTRGTSDGLAYLRRAFDRWLASR